jgi:hypothetical protein
MPSGRALVKYHGEILDDEEASSNEGEMDLTPPQEHHDGIAIIASLGIAKPPHDQHDGLVTPPHEHHDGILTPPHELYDGIVTPPHELHDGIATPPHQHHDGITTPPYKHRDGIVMTPRERYDGIATSSLEHHNSIATPPHEHHYGISIPPHERYDGIATPLHEHLDGVVTPPQEHYDGIATPPQELDDGIATPPHEHHDGIPTPHKPHDGIATPSLEHNDGIVTPPHEHHDGIAKMPHEHHDGIVTPPHEHHNGTAPLPHELHDGIATPPREHHDGIAMLPHEYHDGIVTPPHEHHVGIATPPHEHPEGTVTPSYKLHDGIVTPPHEHYGGIATPPNERHVDIVTTPHEHRDGVAMPPHEHHDGVELQPREHKGGVVLPPYGHHDDIATLPLKHHDGIVMQPRGHQGVIVLPPHERHGGVGTPPHNDGYSAPHHHDLFDGFTASALSHLKVSPEQTAAAERFAAMLDGDVVVRALSSPMVAKTDVRDGHLSIEKIVETSASDGVRRKIVSLTSVELWKHCVKRIGAAAFAIGSCKMVARRRRAMTVHAGGLALAFARRTFATRRATRVSFLGILVRSARVASARRAWARLFVYGVALAMRRARLSARFAPIALSVGVALGGIRARRKNRLTKFKAAALAARAVSAFQGAPRTKGLHWEVLSGEAVEGTIWDSGAGTAPELSSSLFGGLLEKFTEDPKKKATRAAVESAPADSAPSKPERAGLRAVLEPDVSLNLAISLSSVTKYDVDDAISAIRELEPERIGGLDKVSLLAACPILFDVEKLAPLKAFSGAEARATLVVHERFAAALFFELPGARLRLSAMDFFASFSEIRSSALTRCSLLSAASKELCSSRRLSTLLLDVILPLGNRLNANKGPALGFKVSSLSKLVQTRSSSGESFLQFIVEGLATREPDLLCVVDDFAMLQRANSGAAVSRELISADLSRLIVGAKQAHSLATLATKAGETRVAERATTLAAAATEAADQVSEADRDATRAYAAAARWLGEDPKTTPPETLFGYVQSFFAALTRDIKSREDRVAREEKTRRTNERAAAAIPPERRPSTSRRVPGGGSATSPRERASIPSVRRAMQSRRVSDGDGDGDAGEGSSRAVLLTGVTASAQKHIETETAAAKGIRTAALPASILTTVVSTARARAQQRAAQPTLPDELKKALSPHAPPGADPSRILLQRLNPVSARVSLAPVSAILSARAPTTSVSAARAPTTSVSAARAPTTSVSITRSAEGGLATSVAFPLAARPQSMSSRNLVGGARPVSVRLEPVSASGATESSNRRPVRVSLEPDYAGDAVSRAIEEGMRKRQSASFQSFAEIEASAELNPLRAAASPLTSPSSPSEPSPVSASLKSPLSSVLRMFGFGAGAKK